MEVKKILQKARGLDLSIEVVVVCGNYGFEVFQKINKGHEYFSKKYSLPTETNYQFFRFIIKNYIIALSEKSRFSRVVILI